MEIVTNRFLLREFADSDIADFEKYHNDPRSLEFYGAEEARPGHARELIGLFQAWAAEQPRLNYQLAIIQRKAPQALVGCCGLRSAGSEAGTAELGIELAPDYWGRFGYAIEVMRSLVEFGFGRLGLQTIYGSTSSANSRIARLVSAFGAKAIDRPSPAWISAKGWTQVEWQLTREQWDGGRLTKRSSRRAEARLSSVVRHEFHRSGKEVRRQQRALAKERLNFLYVSIRGKEPPWTATRSSSASLR